MATYGSIQEYFLHQQSSIEHYLELCQDSDDAELIHELRLSIKKFRAFNILARQLFAADYDKYFHVKNKVNQLYRLAGELRDTQVQINMLDSFEEQEGIEYPEFKNWLLARENKRNARFRRNIHNVASRISEKKTKELTMQILAQTNDETVINCSEKVLDGLFEKACKLSEGNIADRDLHQLRISTKQLRYILNIVQQSYPGFEFNKVSVESLREIEAAAGHWHDTLVRVDYLAICLERLNLTDKTDLKKYKELTAAFKYGLRTAYKDTCQVAKINLLAGNQSYLK